MKNMDENMDGKHRWKHWMKQWDEKLDEQIRFDSGGKNHMYGAYIMTTTYERVVDSSLKRKGS